LTVTVNIAEALPKLHIALLGMNQHNTHPERKTGGRVHVTLQASYKAFHMNVTLQDRVWCARLQQDLGVALLQDDVDDAGGEGGREGARE